MKRLPTAFNLIIALRQLVFAQNISDQNLEAAQLNQQANMGWGAWGGMGWR